MEQNTENQNQNSSAPKKSYWKFVAGLLGIIIGVFVLLTAGLLAIRYYRQWQGDKKMEEISQKIKQQEQENYQRAMADTYGGKTPQETLRMYIDAVEKDDYELASKYFIGDRQEKELIFLTSLNNDQLKWLLTKMLKNTTNKSIENLTDEKFYTIKIASDKPNIYYSIIDFKKYPNNIWKIIEITPENF